MNEEKPFTINNLSEEQLNELFNHYIKIRSGFLPYPTTSTNPHTSKSSSKKQIYDMDRKDV
jgi:hypothetical protein